MQRTVFILLLLLGTHSAFSQGFKPGKVSVEELKEKFHPLDSSAPAAILYKSGRTYFELNDGYFNMVTEVEQRIKIYTKEGYKYATEEVPYYTGGKRIKVIFSDAYTYNLAGGNIEKTRLKADGEFEEQVNGDYAVKKITMPNVKEGSVIEYRYIIKTPYFSALGDWYFQYPIPANNVTYDISIPVYFSYNRYLTGYINVNQSQQKTRMDLSRSFQETNVVFSAENIKALKNEAYVVNIDNYLSVLKHELASVHMPKTGIRNILQTGIQ